MTNEPHWLHLMGCILEKMVSCRCRCSSGQHSTTELLCCWICSCPELCHLFGLYRGCTGSQSWALQQIAWTLSEVELRWGHRLRGPGSGCWWWGTSWWCVFLIGGEVLIRWWIQLNTSQWMGSYLYSSPKFDLSQVWTLPVCAMNNEYPGPGDCLSVYSQFPAISRALHHTS